MSTIAEDTFRYPDGTTDDIRAVPQEAATREAIRAMAADVADGMDTDRSSRQDLGAVANQILGELQLPRKYLGWAMIAVDNAVWKTRFLSVPFHRRLLLLPQCLRDAEKCQGQYDSVGLHCAGCGACVLYDLKQEAEGLGYDVIIAEGTSSALMHVMQGKADAILGVACMDSMDRSFERVTDLGVPHQAVPLLTDGCVDTEAEVDYSRSLLGQKAAGATLQHRSYVPLLREARDIFESSELDVILDRSACPPPQQNKAGGSLATTDTIARDWLKRGGKRFRPFVTIAAYAVAMHGTQAMSWDGEVASLVPDAVREIAVAIEALHKASLAHDDIEDDDAYRYGEETLHQQHGVPMAINVGDYLIGIGYRLIAAQKDVLSPACIADILDRLSAAHLDLCCGQGGELTHDGADNELTPRDALQIGALKTAPAFEVALYAGLRAADANIDWTRLKRFTTFVGEAYQVLNDLQDWDDCESKLVRGSDALARRPTILRAFALEAGGHKQIADIISDGISAATVNRLKDLYEKLGAFERAELLYQRLREKALKLGGDIGDEALRELMGFLVRSILPDRTRLTGVHAK
ncbi:MAG: polyprenyl synthetase family protein [Armatimonadota bacterium]